MPENPTEAINIVELKEIMDDDVELIQDCFTEFLNEWPVQYVDIKQAIMTKNAQALDETAHKLKGTLRYLAAESAANAAYALEAAGKEKEMENLDRKLEHLKEECRQVVEYIKGFTP